MDAAETIWNRALGFSGPRGTGEGDLALSSLLSVHSLTMNGGLLHAIESLPEPELEAQPHGLYDSAVASDSVIYSAFQTRLAGSPSSFDPPE